jgi:hypothetical protein
MMMMMMMMMREMIVQTGLREGAKETRIEGRERKVSSSDAIPLSLSNPRLCQCLTVCTQERPPNQVSSLHPRSLNHLSHPTLTPHLPAPQMALPAFLGTVTALVTIPTKDGHLLEFDPLQTSPGTLDALEGISDSAKKQAREEMARLVQAAVNMWKIA